MAKSAKKTSDKEMKYASPFADLIQTEIQRIIADAPKKERGDAIVAILKTLFIALIGVLRFAERDRIEAFIMMMGIWDTMDETDEKERQATGGLH
jgi:hypothetical protein